MHCQLKIKSKSFALTFFLSLFLHYFSVSGYSAAIWFPQNSGFNVKLESVHFTSSSQGWAVGEGLNGILKTTDGGTNWAVDLSPGPSFHDVFFINASVTVA